MQISFPNKIIGNLLHIVAKLAKHTATIQVNGMNHIETLSTAGKPILWSSWHGQTMLLCAFMLQYLVDRRATFLIPNDWRGEGLFHFLSKLGMLPHPTNLENKGMDTARRLAQLVRLIKKDGYDNYIAPDGPAGPSYVVKPGAFFISQKVNAPIVPIGAYGRAVYKVKRWDGYVLPYPFARISIQIGEPLTLPKELSEQEKSAALTAALHQATMQAEANFYATYGNAH